MQFKLGKLPIISVYIYGIRWSQQEPRDVNTVVRIFYIYIKLYINTIKLIFFYLLFMKDCV